MTLNGGRAGSRARRSMPRQVSRFAWTGWSCATSSASRTVRSSCGAAGATSSRSSPAGSGRRSLPDEYHLTFSAAGLPRCRGVYAQGHRAEDDRGDRRPDEEEDRGLGPRSRQQTITGTVTRDGRPVRSGWVGLWASEAARERGQLPSHAGRTAVGAPAVFASSPIRDGAYIPRRAVPERDLVRRRGGAGPSAHAGRSDPDRPEPEADNRHHLHARAAASAAGSRACLPAGRDTSGSSPSARPPCGTRAGRPGRHVLSAAVAPRRVRPEGRP